MMPSIVAYSTRPCASSRRQIFANGRRLVSPFVVWDEKVTEGRIKKHATRLPVLNLSRLLFQAEWHEGGVGGVPAQGKTGRKPSIRQLPSHILGGSGRAVLHCKPA